MATHANGLDSLALKRGFDGEIELTEPMSAHTSYHVGGNAKYFIVANSLGSLIEVLKVCKMSNVEYFICGKGSNLLVSDNGFDGAVICLGRDFRKISIDDETHTITAGAGVQTGQVAQEAMNRSFSGMEFASGIPGTIGGALAMNAGIQDQTISSIVKSVSFVDKETFEIKKVAKQEIDWGYRKTNLSDFGIAVECELKFADRVDEMVRAKMEALLNKRKATQPFGYSCGSVFKNPPGHSAGKLIEDAGLKGKTIGGAQVSDVHGNFITNINDASASDIKQLIDLVKQSVLDKFGVKLECEVKLLGF